MSALRRMTNSPGARSGGESRSPNRTARTVTDTRDSYVAALELRIEKLERRLQFAKSRKASVAFHDTDASAMAQVDRRDSLASIRAAIHRKAARNRENHDVNSIVSDFGFLYACRVCITLEGAR